MKKRLERLLFIFDANSGKWGAFVDSAKKILMIKGCALCTITHGVLGEKAEWKTCKEEFGVPIDYIHKDEIGPELKALTRGKLPCLVAQTIGGEYFLLVPPDALERCGGSASELKGKVNYYAASKNLSLVA